jgi:hypothetical protein
MVFQQKQYFLDWNLKYFTDMNMKRTIFICIFLLGLSSVRGQILITVDSLVESKWDISKAADIPTRLIKENMSIEIDKDLLTLRIFGKTGEMAYIEKGYIIDFLEVNDAKDKWLFQGSDKYCIPCTITLDLKRKRISFITYGKEHDIDKPLNTIYYTIVDVKINNDAIEKHLIEKGDRKF